MGGVKLMFTLIPLYNPQAVWANWSQITKGMEEILKYQTGDTNLEKIFNDCLSGNLLIWVGYEGDEYKGFCTTRIDNIPTVGRFLSIVHVFTEPGLLGSVIPKCMERLSIFAKENGCIRYRMWTIRDKAFNKILEPEGWKQGYTEFIKEVV